MHEAPHWYPNYDYPNERSSSEVICRVPKDMTVLSNGRLISEEMDSESGLKVVRWLQEKPHVNYLIALVAGRLKKIE
ncbi:MAG: M1 family aminopeptidase, partial [Planctomycetota bacterium]